MVALAKMAVVSVPPLLLAAAALSLLCLLVGLRAGRRRRLIDDLPTSKTSGVFIGLVELKGQAQSPRPLTSFLAERPCVHFSWAVDEHWSRTVTETYTDSQGRTQTRTRHESGWTTVASGGDSQPFYLRDETGAIRVVPQGARIEPLSVFDVTCDEGSPLYYGKGPPHSVSDSDHYRHFHESAIPVGADIYIVGTARERDDVVAPQIVHDRDAPLFLISTRTEAQVATGMSVQYWLLGVLGLLLLIGGWMFVYREVDRGAAAMIARCAPAGAAYLLVWLLASAWMIYNSLVGLRQRVRQGWANVDVQLKRRNDLIPPLVQVIRGLRDHERMVQTQLAQLRAQLQATPPGQPGPDPRGCRNLIAAVVERYPELRSSEAFLSLQKSLVDTEQRIALARDYFHNIATFYNTRLERIPDRFVAALARLRPQALLSASGFERAPVTVDLAR